MNNITIQGILTSRIETKIKDRTPFYYGFFKLKEYSEDIPVIFKIKEKYCQFCEEVEKTKAKCSRDDCGYWKESIWIKPNLNKDSEVRLTGIWAQGKDRPSFTCSHYQLLKEPEPPTLASLQKQISFLLRPSLDKKKDWSETTDFLFRKKKDLEEIEKLANLGDHYLKAYLLTRQVFYANYQAEHLPLADFSLASYLERIHSELEILQRQMIASGWKEDK